MRSSPSFVPTWRVDCAGGRDVGDPVPAAHLLHEPRCLGIPGSALWPNIEPCDGAIRANLSNRHVRTGMASFWCHPSRSDDRRMGYRHSSSRSRRTASLAGFFDFSHTFDGPPDRAHPSASTRCLPAPCGRHARTRSRRRRSDAQRSGLRSAWPCRSAGPAFACARSAPGRAGRRLRAGAGRRRTAPHHGSPGCAARGSPTSRRRGGSPPRRRSGTIAP